MTNYEELFALLQQTNEEKAEFLEEAIDIMTHKLKFLPQESFPNVIILSQKKDLMPDLSPSLREKSTLAGGRILEDFSDNPHIIIVVQDDASLYSVLPNLLDQEQIKGTMAYQNNAIYIIDKSDFDTDITNFLEETEVLAEILQPKYFFFGHEGNYWTKFDLN